MDSALMLRLASVGSGNEPPIVRECVFPVLSERLRLIAENPVAAALSYRQVLDAVFSHLLSLSASPRRSPPVFNYQNRRGVLGQTVAFAGVTEAQGRGSLHAHLLVWTQLQPDVIEEFVDDQVALETIRVHLNSVQRSFISPDGWRRRDPERSSSSSSSSSSSPSRLLPRFLSPSSVTPVFHL